jgi:hypothetical protein
METKKYIYIISFANVERNRMLAIANVAWPGTLACGTIFFFLQYHISFH